jgi:hypothetical protein
LAAARFHDAGQRKWKSRRHRAHDRFAGKLFRVVVDDRHAQRPLIVEPGNLRQKLAQPVGAAKGRYAKVTAGRIGGFIALTRLPWDMP